MTHQGELHPAHLHTLQQTDLRSLYQQYQCRWQCDCCKNSFDATSSEQHRYAYHCNKCLYDLCRDCWRGYYHPFHTHRLRPAKPDILYPSSYGSWRCDACSQAFSDKHSCYNCQPCKEVDLCLRCFEGTWTHPLHPPRGHTLKPVDPRIEYRSYDGWSCSMCNKEWSFDDNDKSLSHLLFHCTSSNCDFDLCAACFKGEKHHLHHHPLVKTSANWNQEQQLCNGCKGTLQGIGTAHVCFDSNCNYLLCAQCFLQKPQPHPLHPQHALQCTNPIEVFTSSNYSWNCSNCQSSRGETDPLYYCQQCNYGLCLTCYQRSMTTNPLTTGSRQYASLMIKPESYRTPVSLLGGVPSRPYIAKSLPAVSAQCLVCRAVPADVTFSHNGMPHQMSICCQQCAGKVMRSGRKCPLCNQLIDRVINK